MSPHPEDCGCGLDHRLLDGMEVWRRRRRRVTAAAWAAAGAVAVALLLLT